MCFIYVFYLCNYAFLFFYLFCFSGAAVLPVISRTDADCTGLLLLLRCAVPCLSKNVLVRFYRRGSVTTGQELPDSMAAGVGLCP